MPSNVFENIVVFSYECELKNITTTKPYNHIVNRAKLVNIIESIERASNENFDWEDLEKFRESLKSINQSGIIQNIKHVSRVKTIQSRNKK